MATYRYIGAEEREFPGDGVPSFAVAPGDQVESDRELDPVFFEAVKAARPATQSVSDAEEA